MAFGTGSDADWKPWEYQKRISDSNLAKRKKEELAMKSVTDQTKRSNFTSYMGSIKSRQEEAPVAGRFISNAKFEPLHGKNNTTKEVFLQMLKLAVDNSDFGDVQEYRKLRGTILFVRFVNNVHRIWHCNELAKKLRHGLMKTKVNPPKALVIVFEVRRVEHF